MMNLWHLLVPESREAGRRGGGWGVGVVIFHGTQELPQFSQWPRLETIKAAKLRSSAREATGKAPEDHTSLKDPGEVRGMRGSRGRREGGARHNPK